jgi:hypothetical protein
MEVYTPVIPALGKHRQEDFEFKTNVGYIARPYLKKEKKKKISMCHPIEWCS